MSLKVVVITEDHTHDRYIVRPIVERLFADLERSARVDFGSKPGCKGWRQVLSADTCRWFFDVYQDAQILIFVVDRDGDKTREAGIVAERLREARVAGKPMLACLAVEEVETWALALHFERGSDEWPESWEAIRSECNPKQVFFEPLMKRKNWHTGIGRGRRIAMKDLPQKWDRLKDKCPEIKHLADQIHASLQPGFRWAND